MATSVLGPPTVPTVAETRLAFRAGTSMAVIDRTAGSAAYLRRTAPQETEFAAEPLPPVQWLARGATDARPIIDAWPVARPETKQRAISLMAGEGVPRPTAAATGAPTSAKAEPPTPRTRGSRPAISRPTPGVARVVVTPKGGRALRPDEVETPAGVASRLALTTCGAPRP